MFRFANPEYLYLLLLLPVVCAVLWYSHRRKRGLVKKIGDKSLLLMLVPDYSSARRKLKLGLILTAMVLTIIMIARPQFGSKIENVKRQGVEVIFALDVSNSMMAEDVTPNRLEKAKRMMMQLIDARGNDKVGLIVFAGDAYIQIPITSDYVSAKMFMSSINTSLVPTQGTSIGEAIDLATRSFGGQDEDSGEKAKVGRAIIVITDGENHEDDAVEAAKMAASKGIIVNVVGIGSPEGAPIPQQGLMSFKKDENGDVVITKLNEQMCVNIAKAGNGIYVRVDNSNNAQKVIEKALDTMAKSDVESKVYSEYDEQFQVFACLILLLLVAELFISEKRNKFFDNIKIFGDDKKK
ncbi:MAG: VWA domain-containing protein [Paludibacteraceae bacterium]|nr:VWA domain-containing protein [Paludibacteraceae bacterium]